MNLSSHPWIGALAGASADQYGGKAHGLSQLVGRGFQVPQGFCVHVDAFIEALRGASAQAGTLEQLRQNMRCAPLPHDFEVSVERALERLPPDTLWAVRSSSVEEDGASASLAGQGLTLLNVPAAEVLDGVRAVWASHFEAHALMYRQRMRQPLVGGGMGVVIQRMVDARVAGVAFSEDVLNERTSHSVISVASGGGAQVVDGREQHTYRMNRRTHAIEGDLEGQDWLSAELLFAVDALAQRCAQAFGGARDVEWAVDHDGRLWALQQRPLSVEAQDPEDYSVWSNANVGEALPGVGTPLTWSIIRRFSEKGFERAFRTMGLSVPEDLTLVQGFRGRVYLNLSAFMQVASAIPLLGPQTLASLAGGGGGRSVQGSYTPASSWSFLGRLPLTIPRVAFNQLSMPVLTRAWSVAFERAQDAFDAQDLSSADRAKLKRVGVALDKFFDLNGLIMLTCSSNFLMSYVIMKQTLGLFLKEPSAHDLSLMGDLGVRSAEPGMELLPIAHAIRQQPQWRALFEQRSVEEIKAALTGVRVEASWAPLAKLLSDFVEVHGYRAPKEAELATPRWREDLSFVIGVLKGFTQASSVPSVASVDANRAAQAQRSRSVIDDALPGPLRAPFGALLGLTRSNAKRREALRARVVESLDMYRRYFLACGQRMAGEGALARASDVFFLTDEEVRRWVSGQETKVPAKALVLVRQEVHRELEAMSDPPQTFILRGRQLIDEARFLNQSGSVASAGAPTASDDQHVLQGIAGGGGRVEGVVRVALRPEDAVDLTPETILVVPQADVGWTPLFLQIGGVIMELGGPLSHACIVAREYGVTSVVNVPGVLSRLSDGMRVIIDGQTGQVVVSHET